MSCISFWIFYCTYKLERFLIQKNPWAWSFWRECKRLIWLSFYWTKKWFFTFFCKFDYLILALFLKHFLKIYLKKSRKNSELTLLNNLNLKPSVHICLIRCIVYSEISTSSEPQSQDIGSVEPLLHWPLTHLFRMHPFFTPWKHGVLGTNA